MFCRNKYLIAAGIYSIVFSVEVLIVVVIGTFGNSTMTLTGEAKGKKDRNQYKQILGMFSRDEQIITGCGIYLIMVCINLFGKSGNIIVGAGIKGNGDTKWMLCTQIFVTVLVVARACLFVYGLKLGIVGGFMAVIVDEGGRSLINLGEFLRIVKMME